MIWGYGGSGLRTTISVSGYWLHVLNDLLSFQQGHFFVPTGTFLFFAVLALLMWLFMRSKTGTAMTAVGSNPEFARASGVNVAAPARFATVPPPVPHSRRYGPWRCCR